MIGMIVKRLKRPLFILFLLAAALGPCSAMAADPGANLPLFSIDVDQEQSTGKVGVVMQIFLLMTVLSLAPSILVMLTSFTRIAIVLSLLRQAIGSNQIPPSQIIIGLSLFLTFFIMTPVWQSVHQEAIKPYLANEIDSKQAFEKALQPVRDFMIKQTREKDLSMMVQVAKLERPKNIGDVPTQVLIPSFIISELKTAFQIGFMLYIPFLIIDMVVASVLLSMGMMMLPPVMVSLPFKLMIFVLTDGWYLIVGSLVKSFVV
jgi:flagellar biosynthetic protein FliP